jgi:PAS domain S-box-containing protein
MKLYLNKKITAGFAISMIVILSLGIGSFFYIRNVLETGRGGIGNQQIMLQSEQLRSLTTGLQSLQLTYTLTGDEKFATQYKETLYKVNNLTQQFGLAVQAFPTLTEQTKKLEARIRQIPTLETGRLPGSSMTFNAGGDLIPGVHETIDEIQNELSIMKREHQARSTARFYRFVYGFSILLLAGMLTPALLAYSLNRNLKARFMSEEKLTQATSAIHDLYEKAPCGYFSIDREGMISNMNETLLGWLRYQHHEVVNHLHVDQILGKEANELMAEIGKNLSAFSGREIELSMTSKDGTVTPVIINTMILPDRKGSVSLRCSVFDNTKRKAAEEESKILHKELESFSYSVSHDLRAPLRSINGYVEILFEDHAGNMDPEMKKYLSVISNNARRMGQLIDDLLHFSKMGRTEILKVRTDMDTVVKPIVSELIEQEKNENLRLDFHSLGSAAVDVNMIRQVWINLISNALKYSRKKETPHIVIGSAKEGNEMIYYVKDNGAGFDMKYAPKLFGVFQRLHKPEDFEGTGVGLALVKRIVDRHHGKIWVEAKLNEGAAFYFSLPDK